MVRGERMNESSILEKKLIFSILLNKLLKYEFNILVAINNSLPRKFEMSNHSYGGNQGS